MDHGDQRRRHRIKQFNSPNWHLLFLSSSPQRGNTSLAEIQQSQWDFNSPTRPQYEHLQILTSAHSSNSIPGRPAPRVTWWHDNVEISSLSHPSADEGVQAIVNQLFIGTVTREYLGTKLQCRAQGSKLVGAVVKEVTVQVHCK